MQFIDLTHEIYDGMPAFPGEKPLSLKQTHQIPEAGYSNFNLTTGLHIGTHLDSPAHFLEDGTIISKLDLNRLCGKGYVVDAHGFENINMDCIGSKIIPENSIVLICTGYYKNYGSETYYYDYPVLSREICGYFISRKVKMICLDTPSPDKSPYELHPLLFKEGILIAENLTNTEQLLSAEKFDIFALPLKIKADGSPVRIIASV